MALPSFKDPKFKILDGEISEHNFSLTQIRVDFLKCGAALVAFLNALEAFSIFFASRIAEESVAYRETGQSFLKMAKRYMPGIFYIRDVKGGRLRVFQRQFDVGDRLESARIG
jgi:hypothetical protein